MRLSTASLDQLMRMFKVIYRALITAVLVFGLSACELISISEDVSYNSDDRALPLATIEKIEPGKTNRLWLEKQLGPADEVVEKDGVVVCQYHYSEQVAQRFRVFLLFQYRGSTSRDRTLFVQLKNDLVEEVWLEGNDLPETDVANPDPS